MILKRLIFVAVGLFLAWQAIVFLTGVPRYILPGPVSVAKAVFSNWESLIGHALTTFLEIVIGLLLGTILGATSAVSMMASRSLKRWILPVLVMSQAIPVFALAPLPVL